MLNPRLWNQSCPSLPKLAMISLVLPFFVVCLSPSSAYGESEHVTYHDEEGYDISFHENGTFTAICRCVAIDPTVSMCAKVYRAIIAVATEDPEAGIHEWEMDGTMRSGSRFDLRQACFLAKNKSEFCCSGSVDDYFEKSKKFYHGELLSTNPDS